MYCNPFTNHKKINIKFFSWLDLTAFTGQKYTKIVKQQSRLPVVAYQTEAHWYKTLVMFVEMKYKFNRIECSGDVHGS